MSNSTSITELRKRLGALDLWPFKALDKKRSLILISPCTMKDLEPLVRMYDTFEPKAAVQGLPPLDSETRAEWIGNNLANSLNFKVELDRAIIAHGMLSPFPGSPLVEFGLFVHNEYQHHGIGAILTRVIIVAARRMGLRKLWVSEERSNSRAVNLYLKSGFEKVRHERNELEFELDLSTVSEDQDMFYSYAEVTPRPEGEIVPPEPTAAQEVFEETSSLFIFSPEFEKFKLPREHPFRTDRSRLTLETINRYQLSNIPGTQFIMPLPLDEASVLTFHHPQYYYYLEMADRGGFMPVMLEFGLGTGDNPVVPGILDYCLMAAGASVMSADMLDTRQELELVFSPTGGFHHAGSNFAAGFCYINDAVLAIKYLLQRGKKKVLYVDIDAHHGDGVQFAFYDDPRVLNISLHESGRTLFPWNSGFENELGEGDGYGFNINVPLAPGTNDEIYRDTFERVALPLARQFQPEVCVAVVGVDTMFSDPMTNLSLTNNGFCEVITKIRDFAPKLLLLGGGGYNPDNIARTWTLAWAVLHDSEPEENYFGEVGMMVDSSEAAAGTLRDTPPFIPPVKIAEAAAEAKRVVRYIEKEVFPLHELSGRG